MTEDIKEIYKALSQPGKNLLQGLSHFEPTTGGPKIGVLYTCQMDEKAFQLAASELQGKGLLSQGTLQNVPRSIVLKPEDYQETLKRHQREGLLNETEADNAQYIYKIHVKNHPDEKESKIDLPPRQEFIENPEGNRYRLKRYEEIQEYLKQSGIRRD